MDYRRHGARITSLLPSATISTGTLENFPGLPSSVSVREIDILRDTGSQWLLLLLFQSLLHLVTATKLEVYPTAKMFGPNKKKNRLMVFYAPLLAEYPSVASLPCV